MWVLYDLVVGEIIEIVGKEKAIQKAKERIEAHNSEFGYSHRGKHYSQNATYIIFDNEHKIEIVRK